MTTDLDDLSAFVTASQRKIRGIKTPEDYRLISWWVLGAPEYKRLPDGSVVDLLAHLEAKRIEVLQASGALVG